MLVPSGQPLATHISPPVTQIAPYAVVAHNSFTHICIEGALPSVTGNSSSEYALAEIREPFAADANIKSITKEAAIKYAIRIFIIVGLFQLPILTHSGTAPYFLSGSFRVASPPQAKQGQRRQNKSAAQTFPVFGKNRKFWEVSGKIGKRYLLTPPNSRSSIRRADSPALRKSFSASAARPGQGAARCPSSSA